MKCVLYEEGVFFRIKQTLAKENPYEELACAAVLQNISEHRFLKGKTFFSFHISFSLSLHVYFNVFADLKYQEKLIQIK